MAIKNIRTGQGDILNELKKRRDIELGKNQTIRTIKKHYVPNVLGGASALTLATLPLGKAYRGYIQKDRTKRVVQNINSMGDTKSVLKEVGMMVAPELIGAGMGAYAGFKSGRSEHKREKLMTDRLKDMSKEHLFDSLSDKGKEQYAYHLGKIHGTPIIKQLQEKRNKQREAMKELRGQMKANDDSPPVRISLEKEAAYGDAPKFEVGDIHKTPKHQIFDELIIRRKEALGQKVTGLRRRDFKKNFIENFKNPNSLKAAGIVGAVSTLAAHRNIKDENRIALDKMKSDGVMDMNKRLPNPNIKAPMLGLALGPGLHMARAGSAAFGKTIGDHFNRKKNRYALADHSTEELEKKLGKTLLTKLYREHGAEGEEYSV